MPNKYLDSLLVRLVAPPAPLVVWLSFQLLDLVLFDWLLLKSFICSASILWDILTWVSMNWEWCSCGGDILLPGAAGSVLQDHLGEHTPRVVQLKQLVYPALALQYLLC